MRPKAKHSAAGIRKIASICTKFDSGVGFSYGCAELALKKPPPLVPSILIAICEATGPIAQRLRVGALVLHHRLALGVLQRLAVGAESWAPGT